MELTLKIGTTDRPPSPLWMTSPSAAVAVPGRAMRCAANYSSMISELHQFPQMYFGEVIFTTELTLKSHLTRNSSESHAKKLAKYLPYINDSGPAWKWCS